MTQRLYPIGKIITVNTKTMFATTE
uniref:Uncharacterized protein n=1 Tax=Anguilla anguilla TaxID=7936 RepID=A0A0E9UKF5_ANGAN